ncbi:MAG TPA: NlpC/P60 family protein [Gaiellaceae bacterium]|nr:NlpC/P60 family protein [Gaiellaceae bacterium]
MRRLIGALVCACLALGAPTAVLAAKRSWAYREIAFVTGQGLMGGDAAAFRPDAPLTKRALGDLVLELGGLPGAEPPDPGAPATMAELDQALVRGLALSDDARRFYLGARATGVKPPARFGSEVTARLLGLRMNHPAALDALELRPDDPATRAEAAYSAAQILRFGGWEVPAVETAALEFQLPVYTSWQRRILQTAFGLIGYPYVWGGTSRGEQTVLGVRSRGGFDCSGFAWRVYKVTRYAGGGRLNATLRGRTAAQMAGEVPRTLRIDLAALEPGDLVFFGQGGRRARAAAVDHMGVYAGNGWMIHSSRFGVALVRLDGWYAKRFAWGRRPLAEAGLA